MQSTVRIVIEQKPVELFFLLPLDKLPELLTHEQKLFSGVRIHVPQKDLHAREFFFICSGHLVYQRALAVHDLIVRNRQNEILRKSVKKRKRYQIVIVFSRQTVKRGVAENVVHPAHVPFEIETESSV